MGEKWLKCALGDARWWNVMELGVVSLAWAPDSYSESLDMSVFLERAFATTGEKVVLYQKLENIGII